VTMLAEPGQQVRPPERRKSRDVILPLIVFTIAVALIAFTGEFGPLWGALLGIVTFGLFAWIGLTRSILDGIILVVGGVIAMTLVILVLATRGDGISFAVALRAALSVGVFGLATGIVTFRNSHGLKISTIGLSGLAWGSGAYLALLTAVAMGILEAVKEGETQELTFALFISIAVASAAIGASANVSFWLSQATPFAVGVVAIVSILAWNEIGFSLYEIWNQVIRIGDFVSKFWPPDFVWSKSPGQPPTFNMGGALIETLQIAIVGATLGTLLAAPLSFMASRPTSPNPTVYWISKSFLNVIRTIPDLFWAIFFATAVGFGRPFAGALAMIMFSLAIMAKLLSETVDAIDLGPLEAARAAGATHGQVVRRAAFPQVLPNFVAYALYVFELNIRASVVIGIVGAGGIGRLLDERRQFFQWDQVMAIVLVIFAAVLIIETVSIYARRKIV